MSCTRSLFLGMALSLVASLGSGTVSRLPDAMPNGASDRAFPLQAIVRALDAQAYDEFGDAVAVSRDVAIVGSWTENGGPGDPLDGAGAAYVFRRDKDGAAQWGQVKKLTASDPQADGWFGDAVAVSGDVAIVGAPGDAGAAYVFRRDKGGASNWGQVAKLTAPDAQTGDKFGYSVAIDGDTAIVGARGEDGGPGDPSSYAGAAYVFQNIGGSGWLYLKTIRASDTQAGDYFGRSVAVSGDIAIVGADGEDGGASTPLSSAGAAYVYSRNQNGDDQWGEVTKLTASDSGAGDEFGNSVGVSGKLAVVGARYEDGGPGDPYSQAGAAYLFQELPGPGWIQVRKLMATDANADQSFGNSVAISGGVVLVGAPADHGGPGDPLSYAGAAYVFMRHLGGTNRWGQARKLMAPDAQAFDDFGFNVALSGKNAIVGAISEDGGAGDPITDAGAAYIFYMSLLEAFKAN